MIWFDNRNMISWALLSYPAGGTVAVGYKVSAILKIISVLKLDSEINLSLLTQQYKLPQYDDSLSIACQKKILKCAVVPLVKEYRTPSMVDTYVIKKQ